MTYIFIILKEILFNIQSVFKNYQSHHLLKLNNFAILF